MSLTELLAQKVDTEGLGQRRLLAIVYTNVGYLSWRTLNSAVVYCNKFFGRRY